MAAILGHGMMAGITVKANQNSWIALSKDRVFNNQGYIGLKVGLVTFRFVWS